MMVALTAEQKVVSWVGSTAGLKVAVLVATKAVVRAVLMVQ